jgi:hypothetical protein
LSIGLADERLVEIPAAARQQEGQHQRRGSLGDHQKAPEALTQKLPPAPGIAVTATGPGSLAGENHS